MSFVTFLIVTGYISWGEAEMGAFGAMLAAIVPLVALVLASLWPRSQVDGPVTAAAKDAEIERLTLAVGDISNSSKVAVGKDIRQSGGE